MKSQENTKKNVKKIWGITAGAVIIISFTLVLLFKEASCGVKSQNKLDLKSEKLNPVSKSGNLAAPNNKESQSPEESEYKIAINQNTISAYREYLGKYPSGIYAKEVENLIKELQEMPEQVRKVAQEVSKGITVKKNDKGAWEADFGDGIIMVFIPQGDFIMGSNDIGKVERDRDEQPAHKVYLEGYWLGKYEVTFEQFDKYCDDTKKEKPDDAGWGRGKSPIISVSWDDAVEYCKWLSTKMGFNFKLPTEAQWEKAARGTNGQKFPWGDQIPNGDLANCRRAGEIGKTVPVGSYPGGASPYGILDMAGNIWEWCSDWYDWYKADNLKQQEYPREDIRKLNFRVLRGASWFDESKFLYVFNRYGTKPTYRGYIVGFRVRMEN